MTLKENETTGSGLTIGQVAEARRELADLKNEFLIDDLCRWCANGAANINITRTAITNIVEADLIERVSDIYLIDSAMLAKHFTLRKAQAYAAAFDAKPRISFARFIYGLNIDSLTRAEAAILAIEYPTIDALLEADEEELSQLLECPDAVDGLTGWLDEPINVINMRALHALGPEVISVVAQQRRRNHWRGKRFLITGRFKNWDHQSMQIILKQFDIELTTSPNVADYILRGKNSNLGIPRGCDAAIWSEKQFENMFVEGD